ncbi:MAG: hypothetical protein KDC34_11175 [Saprospiraceae bacterium]|nr:hypothetical protein [Saprospiraceae bacterium]
MASENDSNHFASGIETKKLKKGLITLQPPLLELQNWIKKEYGVKPLNIIYDIIEPNTKLDVVWETREDYLKFLPDMKEFNNKENLIIEKFRKLAESFEEYTSIKMFVRHNVFSYLAINEANRKVTSDEIEKLINDLSDFEIWKIMKRGSTARFFFFTEEQVEKYMEEECINYLSNRYFELVNKYDEFDYTSKTDLKISIDSKNKVEEIYQGNWQGYFRDN